ncbi:hypothetical protein PGB90_007983 [Kerria lacca]
MVRVNKLNLKCLMLIFVIPLITGDVLTHFAKHKNMIRVMEATTEPLNNVSPYEQVQYSVANLSTDFKSSTKFQPRGMAHLYLLTEKFISYIGKEQAFPEGFLEVNEENTIQVADIGKEWPVLLHHYGAILIVILCAVLFATIMPIIGLTFCCCRCVGRCGARTQPFDKRYDPCRRHFYGAILVIITVLISFGVICAFSTNEVLEEGVTDLPKHVRVALTDSELYINNTKKEVYTLLITNFKELERTLSNILQASGKILLNKLAQATKASVLSNLTNVVEGLSTIKNDLNKINSLSLSLHERSSRLDYGLKQIGSKILQDIRQCQRELPCREFNRKYNVDELSLETNFSQLPNVTASLKNLSDLSAAGIENEVLKGKREFEKIQSYIQESVENTIPLIMGNINKTGKAIEEGAVRVITILQRMKDVISSHVNEPMESGQTMIEKFSPYRYYVCFAVSCTLLIILLFLTFGLLCGCCGGRPNSGYQEDCCNKGAGSRNLMIAVWLMFLTSGVLMAIALIYFVAGITTDKLVCHSLKNPHNSRTFNLLDQLADVNRFYKSPGAEPIYDPINLRTIIRACHRNLSLYQVLQLEKEIDISEVANYPNKFGVNDRIIELVNNIKLDYDINIITEDASNLLRHLAYSELNNINFPAYTNVIGEKMTSIDLLQLATALNETASQLPPLYINITYSLYNSAMYLQTHQIYQVAEMISITKELESIAAQLQEHLKFNHTSLKNAVEHLLEEVKTAQEKLQIRGRGIVTKLATDFGNEFISHIQEYLGKVVSRMQFDIGRCAPVSQAYNATVIAGCNRILYPFNGFWFSVGAVVLLFIPAIIISIILSGLYQKSDKYPGPLVEPEYLYNLYGGDRDDIPLSR